MPVQLISEQTPAETLAAQTLAAETMPASEPIGSPARGHGVIVLVRHGEPNLSKRVQLSAAGYFDWWARYEETGLKPGQTAPEVLKLYAEGASVILCSTRPRAIETAKAIAAGRIVQVDPGLIEAPLPPPNLPGWLKLPPPAWGVIARVHWWFFNKHGQESRAQAQCRADAAAERLIALSGDGDVLVVAHGFFNTMIGISLQRDGWKLTTNQGYKYWSMRRFERKRGMVVTAAGELAAAVLDN